MKIEYSGLRHVAEIYVASAKTADDSRRTATFQLDGKIILPPDRLIRAGEAAQILGVGKSTIGEFVKARLLTPFYVNSDQKRFWLSEVKALPRKKPWKIRRDSRD